MGFDDESVRRSGGLKTDDTWSKKLELMEVMSRTGFLYIEIEFIKLDFYVHKPSLLNSVSIHIEIEFGKLDFLRPTFWANRLH